VNEQRWRSCVCDVCPCPWITDRLTNEAGVCRTCCAGFHHVEGRSTDETMWMAWLVSDSGHPQMPTEPPAHDPEHGSARERPPTSRR